MTGKPVPVPTPETQPFWDGCAAGELRIQRCADCGRPYFYPRPVCPACGGRTGCVVFLGSMNADVQTERMPWLGRLSRLAARWNVVFRAGVFGENYRHLLARSRIVCHASNRHKAMAGFSTAPPKIPECKSRPGPVSLISSAVMPRSA